MSSKFLDYGDVLLRTNDVDLLRGPFWLNDQIIGFYFEYLSREVAHPGLLLVSGSSTFLVANLGPEQAVAVLDPLGFQQAQLVLFAVNDNPDVEAAGGGSHWSLLAFSAADNTFLYYDSLSGSNRSAARRVYQAAKQPGSKFVEQAMPQQQNGYDCGMYVLAVAQLLCQRYNQQAAAAGMSFQVGHGDITPQHVAALRQEVLDLICSKAAAGS